MYSRIHWCMHSGEEVFYQSPGVYHFSLVHEEDARYFELYFIPPSRRVWYDDEEGDDGD